VLIFLFYFLVDRRDGKTIINSHTQSGGSDIRTPVMMSGLTILAFLPIELKLMERAYYCGLFKNSCILLVVMC